MVQSAKRLILYDIKQLLFFLILNNDLWVRGIKGNHRFQQILPVFWNFFFEFQRLIFWLFEDFRDDGEILTFDLWIEKGSVSNLD
jgi:hypothetical protein